MRIVLCVKQVPETDRVSIDPDTGILRREGAPAILNPFCEYALDVATRLKVEHGGEIIVISMGPPQAREALTRCLELGADRGILLSDRAFAGSDVWATSRALVAAIRAEAKGFDIVLMGKQAIDGDTAQVPGEVAEMLGIPSIYSAEAIEGDGDSLVAKKVDDRGSLVIRSGMPALVTISSGSNVRRIPSMADVLEARGKELKVLGASDLGIDPSRCGIEGSLTRVTRIFAPPIRGGGRRVHGAEGVNELMALLRREGVLGGRE